MTTNAWSRHGQVLQEDCFDDRQSAELSSGQLSHPTLLRSPPLKDIHPPPLSPLISLITGGSIQQRWQMPLFWCDRRTATLPLTQLFYGIPSTSSNKAQQCGMHGVTSTIHSIGWARRTYRRASQSMAWEYHLNRNHRQDMLSHPDLYHEECHPLLPWQPGCKERCDRISHTAFAVLDDALANIFENLFIWIITAASMHHCRIISRQSVDKYKKNWSSLTQFFIKILYQSCTCTLCHQNHTCHGCSWLRKGKEFHLKPLKFMSEMYSR